MARHDAGNVTTTTIKPIERIIEIRTKYIVKKEKIERPEVAVPTGQTSERVLLERIESATPNIKSDPIVVTQYDDGSVSTPPTVNGSIQIDYLKYSFETQIDLKVKSISPQNNLHAMSIIKYDGAKVATDIGVCTTIDFWNENVTVGLLTGSISLGLGKKLTKNSAVNVGATYNWTGNMCPYIGISFKL
jgi:hypothetical protein